MVQFERLSSLSHLPVELYTDGIAEVTQSQAEADPFACAMNARR
jgi:hypothetical protein